MIFKILNFLILFTVFVFCNNAAEAKYSNIDEHGNVLEEVRPSIVVDEITEVYANRVLLDLKNHVDAKVLAHDLQEVNFKLMPKQREQLFAKVLNAEGVVPQEAVKEILSTETQDMPNFVATATLSCPYACSQIMMEVLSTYPDQAETVVNVVTQKDARVFGKLQAAMANGTVKLPEGTLKSIKKGLAKTVEAKSNDLGGDNVVLEEDDKEKDKKKNGDGPDPIPFQRMCITISNDVICN